MIWSDKTWRMPVERLKKFCLLNSSLLPLAEVTALCKFGRTEHVSFPAASGQSLVNWAESPFPCSLISLNWSQTLHWTVCVSESFVVRQLATSGERHYLQSLKLFLFSLSDHKVIILAMPVAISPQLWWFGKKEKLLQAQSQNKQRYIWVLFSLRQLLQMRSPASGTYFPGFT